MSSKCLPKITRPLLPAEFQHRIDELASLIKCNSCKSRGVSSVRMSTDVLHCGSGRSTATKRAIGTINLYPSTLLINNFFCCISFAFADVLASWWGQPSRRFSPVRKTIPHNLLTMCGVNFPVTSLNAPAHCSVRELPFAGSSKLQRSKAFHVQL